MKEFRHVHGALSLETIEARPVFHRRSISELRAEEEETEPRTSSKTS